MLSMQIPPIKAKAKETKKIAEYPQIEITVAAMIGAIAWVTVLPKL